MIATKLRRIAKVNIKSILRKIAYGYKAESSSYIEHLKSLGMKIGSDCVIYAPTKTLIDEQYPWMITIGDHVRITEGVKILTHDYSWSVLKNCHGCVLGASGVVEIGDNVFIGMNTIIERNVKIGNNVVIGAGSVVAKDCESDSVYAGVPARRLMSINEFFEKRQAKQRAEARELAQKYYDRFKRRPNPEVFHEYFMLFETNNSVSGNKVFSEKLRLGYTEKNSIAWMKEHTPEFSNYEEFMRYCFDEDEK